MTPRVWSASEIFAGNASEDVMCAEAPEPVLKSIVDGINIGNLDALMSICEPEAAFALQPGTVAQGLAGMRESLEAFIAMKGFVADSPW